MSAAVAPELPKEEGREEERGGRRREKGRRWKEANLRLGVDQTWMAGLQICTANAEKIAFTTLVGLVSIATRCCRH